MSVFVLCVNEGPDAREPIGAYSTWELAQEQADNHAASVYGITKLLSATRVDDLHETRAYGQGEQHIVNYSIIQMEVDQDAPKPEPGFPLV
jgi:hypothetical protein